MREIKFRGKSAKTAEWVYGYYAEVEHNNDKSHVHTVIFPKPLLENPIEPIFIDVDSKTVGQYTGSIDKNKTIIFESDICKDAYGKIYLVKWGINCDGFIAKTTETHSNVYSLYHLAPKIEVVGNIFDNPELMRCQNEYY
jgi:uncharacterized phage protein (TIGR01671 family)